MIEEWKVVKGFEDLYEIRNDGLLHVFPRKWTKEKYTYGSDCGGGYLCLTLSKDEIQETKRVNRLVYETFVGPIPEGYDVHHKNHIKTDNRLENLCLIKSNIHRKIHSKENYHKSKDNLDQSKMVLQCTKDGELVAEYGSLTEASKQTGIDLSILSKCCNKKYGYKSAGGYIWKFKN